MRRTVSIIVCVLMASITAANFCGGVNAQIPEGAQFQPGSYGVPYRYQTVQHPAMVSPVAEYAANEDGGDTDGSTTAWEKKFSPQTMIPPPVASMPSPYEVPHLTYVYCHWTGRFHITPYEPGYAADPLAFPKQTSPLHIWVSSKSAVSQPSPQVPYMSYYDPDPVVLPAEIRLRGSRFSGPLTQLQPMPLPVPRPELTQPISPARTRLGERVRQNFGTFIVPR